MYDTALRYAKVENIQIRIPHCLTLHDFKTASHRDRILNAQADSFFREGRYIPAAQSYAQCSASFEEVTLKFVDADERDALRYYLIARLERTRKSVRGLHLY